MKPHRLGRFALALVLFLGAAASAGASPLSPNVRWVQSTLGAWMASGAKGHVALPEPFLAPVVGLPEPGTAMAPGTEPQVRLIVGTDDPEALREAGFLVRTVAGPVATVTAPLSRLDELAAVHGVHTVHLPRQLSPSLDVSIPETKIDMVHGAGAPPYPPTGLTGTGVVVGVVDTGIDFNHDDFKLANGTSRILKIWDQTTSTLPHPSGYNYGTEWLQSSLTNGTSTERDTDGHGTHVTGIVAGNGRATDIPADQYKFVGAAPEADILFVKTDFLEDSLIDAVNWIWTNAGSKPAVVNLSLGGQFGPHDGTSPLDVGLSALVGPGHLIVAAAGNEGSQLAAQGGLIHAQTLVNGLSSASITFSIPGYTPKSGTGDDILLMDGWYNGAATIRASVRTPNSTTIGPVNLGSTSNVSTTQGRVRVQNTAVDEQSTPFTNGDKAILVDIWDDNASQPPANGTWTLLFDNIGTALAEVDFWISWNRIGSGVAVAYTSNADTQETLASPGTGDKILSVAAYVTKTSWPAMAGTCKYPDPLPPFGIRAPFCSRGPRRDGGDKPDIAAPGMGIASSWSANAGSSEFDDTNCGVTPDGKHYVSQGTSQASPHVAGALALMLQADPDMTFALAQSRLRTSAAHDLYTGQGYSTDYGYGKLDANAAVQTIVPVKLLTLVAAWEGRDAVVRWELSETEPGVRFLVERSADVLGPWTTISGFLDGTGPYAWTDPAPDAAEPWYRVAALLRDGGNERFGPVRLDPLAPQVHLWQNAPNPFAASTVIGFELDKARDVRLEVIDVNGRRVSTLSAGLLPEGRHQVQWDGKDAQGRPVADGIYFYRLTAPGTLFVRRMVLAR